MKVSKVAQLCKSERNITLINANEEDEKPTQWVGTPQAIYPIYGLRTLNKDQLYTILTLRRSRRERSGIPRLPQTRSRFDSISMIILKNTFSLSA